ncbi:hypothetical protein BRD16_00630 [Halobacteriales archaeon SW_6_65_46]|nr:MAG: hypothetical protein BRD16_00630 [Halobacteriales archaeon SW_6_65_46]
MSDRIEGALDGSGLVRATAAARDALAASSSIRAVRRFGQSATAVARDSRLYRWLTAEPEPTVVVIDLRETYTVGPVIALIDRLVTPLSARWEQSTLREKVIAAGEYGERVVGSSRVAGWLARLFEPPEPPDR